MSTFIALTSVKRNGKPFAKSILIDVNKITCPVIENLAGNSIVEVDDDTTYSSSYTGVPEKWEVSEDLAAIDALTDEVFIGTIITYNKRPKYLTGEALFIKSRVFGAVEDNGGGHSKFSYRTLSAQSPDVFEVDESLATINS